MHGMGDSYFSALNFLTVQLEARVEPFVNGADTLLSVESPHVSLRMRTSVSSQKGGDDIVPSAFVRRYPEIHLYVCVVNDTLIPAL